MRQQVQVRQRACFPFAREKGKGTKKAKEDQKEEEKDTKSEKGRRETKKERKSSKREERERERRETRDGRWLPIRNACACLDSFDRKKREGKQNATAFLLYQHDCFAWWHGKKGSWPGMRRAHKKMGRGIGEDQKLGQRSRWEKVMQCRVGPACSALVGNGAGTDIQLARAIEKRGAKATGTERQVRDS